MQVVVMWMVAEERKEEAIQSHILLYDVPNCLIKIDRANPLAAASVAHESKVKAASGSSCDHLTGSCARRQAAN
jgi:hypothetical protein